MKIRLIWIDGAIFATDPRRSRPRKTVASDVRAKMKQVERRRKAKGYR